jgi:medium-chain acyl-[acyl-carrier-protein] hydrolase
MAIERTAELLVSASVSDRQGRVQLRSVARFLADVAGDHAVELGLGRAELGDSRAWMLSRLRIETDRWPRFGEVIRVRTWPSGMHGMFALRDFELLDGAGERWGLAKTSWMVVDLELRRPARIPETLGQFEGLCPPPVLDGFKKLKRPQDAERSEPMAVRWIDADMNGHANLACYVGWAVEAHDHAFLDSHEPAQLHMEFRAETRPGERVISVTDGVTQSLIRESDGAELARLRMEWR